MKHVRSFFAAALAALMTALCACGGDLPGETGKTGSVAGTENDRGGVTAALLTDPADESRNPDGDFTVTSDDGTYVFDGTVVTVSSAGEYVFSGSLAEGQIIVSAGDEDEVTLVFSDAAVSCTSDAPVKILSAAEVTVKAAEGSYNTVTDSRTGDPDAAAGTDENCDAAIYSACDLKLAGKGTLIVTSSYDNGIKTKDDLKIKNVTLKVTAPGNALKGNDSVTVESGAVTAVSTGSDGIKTENTDVSSKGNQRGNISVQGGQVDVYSACDGISAAYNAEISGDAVVNILTADYAGSSSAAGREFYLVVPKDVYSTGSDYYVYIYNEDGSGKWIACAYETMISGGRTASYYGLTAKLPGGYENIIFAVTASGADPDDGVYSAISDGETVNSQMNGYLISSVSGGSVTGDWVQITSGGSSGKTAYSSKGIKAYNEVIISGGAVTVCSMDDGIHANADGTLENGESAKGDITVSGGTVTVTAADDGMHADGGLLISGGTVNITDSHEGLEANVITVTGGTVYVYGDDDGLNAVKGSSSPLINITGGYVDVTTPSGDTDGIDSNGSITVSGGFVIVKGGSSSGSVSGSIDVDGTISVTGGTVIAIGGICETPVSGGVCVYAAQGTAFTAGDYSLSDGSGELASFTLGGNYSSFWIASDEISLNGSYTLTGPGGAVASWTQSSASVGTAGAGGGIGGGARPGGRR